MTPAPLEGSSEQGGERRPQRIVLTGFSGTGKSSVAPLVARRLGWELIDTDCLVEKMAGRGISELFREEGEPRFRAMEAQAVRQACARSPAVVSVGGGAVLSVDNRRLLADGGFIVCLEARPDTCLERLRQEGDGEPGGRPLLAGPDPLGRLRALKASRQPFYALCDWTVQTDGLTPEDVAGEVVRAYELFAAPAMAQPGRLEAIASPALDAGAAIPPDAACLVRTASGSYPVVVRWGALESVGERLKQMGLGATVHVVSDEQVYRHLGAQVEQGLVRVGIPFGSFTIPPGEANKSLEVASQLYDWLVERRAERGHTVLALGGGVVTDLAGFVAATFARGLSLVHAPTSLLAMVDPAIGGKVAVNHPRAKNMIGVFYQPRLVVADVAALRSLPPRELRSGWAEVIKHAFIADEGYLRFLEENTGRILALDPESTTHAIERSVRIKAHVVSLDEREETGLRTILNFGHTVGHAIEAATGYGCYLHGEAVAIGMVAAVEISRRMGLIGPEVATRLSDVLASFGLPQRAEGVDGRAAKEAMALDKKVRGRALRWVLLEGIGRPVVRSDVPPEAVDAAMEKVFA